jgi:hypothetical protein
MAFASPRFNSNKKRGDSLMTKRTTLVFFMPAERGALLRVAVVKVEGWRRSLQVLQTLLLPL